ncbi:MAG: hypothetical protein R3B96_14700 [Pirellulaceae bacterium]
MPLVALSETLGITLMLPLLQGLDSAGDIPAVPSGYASEILSGLPLPNSPAMLLLLVGLAFAAKALFKFCVDVYRGRLDAQLIQRLRNGLVRAVAEVDVLAFVRHNTGHYLDIINAQVGKVSYAFNSLMNIALSLFGAAMLLMAVALVNWRFALVSVVTGVFFSMLVQRLSIIIKRRSRTLVLEQATMNRHLVQYLQSLKYLISTDRARAVCGEIESSAFRIFKLRCQSVLAGAFASNLREPVSVVVLLALIWISVFVLEQPLPSVFVSLLMLDRATKALMAAQTSWHAVLDSMGSIEAVRSELNRLDQHRANNGTAIQGELNAKISFDDASFRYSLKVPTCSVAFRSASQRIRP